MHLIKILMPLTVLVCFSTFGDEAHTNNAAAPVASPDKDTRVWISSFPSGRPIMVTTDHREDHPRPCTPEIPTSMARQWQTNYAVFSEHLVSAAEKAHLDSASLAKILSVIRSREEKAGLAILPVEAHSTNVKGELAWVVGLRWEMKDSVQRHGDMGHVRSWAFTQQTLELVDFQTCD
jgi:hypothetical protein